MAVPTGIEPAISCVTGRHVNRYTTGPPMYEREFPDSRARARRPPPYDDPYGIRTRVTAVKGRCLNRLTKGPYVMSLEHLAAQAFV
jgi:hypothetical protein